MFFSFENSFLRTFLNIKAVLDKTHLLFPQILELSLFTMSSNISERIQKSTYYVWRSSWLIQKQPPEWFCKDGVLKNFPNFTIKHLCYSLFLIKLQALRPATLLKRGSNTGVFLWNYKIFKKTYFEEHLRTVASFNKVIER